MSLKGLRNRDLVDGTVTLEEFSVDAITNADLLVQSCLRLDAFAWQKLVDDYAPVVVLAIQEIAASTGRQIDQTEIDRLTREVFQQLRENDFAVLQEYDRRASLETFLVVVTRRIVQASVSPADEANGPES